jgi:hypothetical protein
VCYIWIDASVNWGFDGRKCSIICLCAAEPLKRIIETIKSPVDADNYSNRVIYILIQDNAISIWAEEMIWKLHKVKCGEILSITLVHKRYKNSWSHKNCSAVYTTWQPEVCWSWKSVFFSVIVLYIRKLFDFLLQHKTFKLWTS